MARAISFLLVVMMCCAPLHPPPPPHPSLFFLKEVLSLFAMPKVNLRNEVGVIVHTVSNRVLSDNTAKNIYDNVNYSNTFLQGTIINVFDGHTPGGKNAVWKLMVDFKMHSKEPTLGVELNRVSVHRQHFTLGLVLAGESINSPALAPYSIAFASPSPRRRPAVALPSPRPPFHPPLSSSHPPSPPDKNGDRDGDGDGDRHWRCCRCYFYPYSCHRHRCQRTAVATATATATAATAAMAATAATATVTEEEECDGCNGADP